MPVKPRHDAVTVSFKEVADHHVSDDINPSVRLNVRVVRRLFERRHGVFRYLGAVNHFKIRVPASSALCKTGFGVRRDSFDNPTGLKNGRPRPQNRTEKFRHFVKPSAFGRHGNVVRQFVGKKRTQPVFCPRAEKKIPRRGDVEIQIFGNGVVASVGLIDVAVDNDFDLPRPVFQQSGQIFVNLFRKRCNFPRPPFVVFLENKNEVFGFDSVPVNGRDGKDRNQKKDGRKQEKTLHDSVYRFFLKKSS